MNINTIQKLPENNAEIAALMVQEGMIEFKSKVIFLQSVLRHKQWHNIHLTDEDVKRLTPIFIGYLKEAQE